jgi:plasmid stabilization system protein ParE
MRSNERSAPAMAAKLIIAPEAAQDIDEAYCWYECQRAGLGEEFLNCVDACMQAICRMPEMHLKVHEDYRRGLVRRFPYAIFYEYARDVVTVYCIFHTSRDPAKWRQRLP